MGCPGNLEIGREELILGVALCVVVAQVDLKTEIDTNAALYLTVVEGR